MDTNTNQQRADDVKAEIERIDFQIAEHQARAAAIKRTMQALQAEVNKTDDELRKGWVPDEVSRARSKLSAQIGEERKKEQYISEEQIRPLESHRFNLAQELDGLQKSLITLGDLQTAVDGATAALAEIKSKRAAVATRLAGAEEKHDEAQTIIKAEDTAADALETLRADAFMLPTGGAKRAKVDEAIANAGMALTVAHEKAATAHAALPRILSTIERLQSDLAETDRQIQSAEKALYARKRERGLWQGERHFVAAERAMRDAIEMIEEHDEDKGRNMRRTLSAVGLRTFDAHGRLVNTPHWLITGFASTV